MHIYPLEPRLLLSVYWVDTLTDGPVDLEDTSTSLREAVFTANLNPGSDIIRFSPELLSSGETGTIPLTEGELTLNSDIEICGPAEYTLIIDAQNSSRIFSITENANITLNNLTLTHGTAPYGGAISVSGASLTAENLSITDCEAASGGGAVYLTLGSAVTLSNSAVTNNRAGWYGGAIYTQNSDLTINRSVFSGNISGYSGGALSIYNGETLISLSEISGNGSIAGGGIVNYGNLSLIGSLLVSNRAYTSGNIPGHTPLGGGLLNYGTARIAESTVAGNSASGTGAAGGGIYDAGKSLTVVNSIAAMNDCANGADIAAVSDTVTGKYTLSSYSGWKSGSVSTLLFTSGDLLFTDPDLGDWSLDPDSAAVDAGSNTEAAADGFEPGSTDLAENPRFNDGVIDLGALEYTPPPAAETPVILTGTNGKYVSYGANRHRIEWSASDGVSEYELIWSSDGINWNSMSVSGNTALLPGLSYNALMHYKVRALGDGETLLDSEWSAEKEFYVCPADVNGDGDISPIDRACVSACWLSSKGDEEYNPACDIDGDGDIAITDRSFLAANWLCSPGEDPIVNPPALADLLARECLFWIDQWD